MACSREFGLGCEMEEVEENAGSGGSGLLRLCPRRPAAENGSSPAVFVQTVPNAPYTSGMRRGAYVLYVRGDTV